jgi:hypothetical protein
LFDLERKRGKQKQLSHLTLPDGSITDSEKDINDITKAFHIDLYSLVPVDDECQNKILENLSQQIIDTGLQFSRRLVSSFLGIIVNTALRQESDKLLCSMEDRKTS